MIKLGRWHDAMMREQNERVAIHTEETDSTLSLRELFKKVHQLDCTHSVL